MTRTGMFESIINIISLILIFVLILVLAYFTAKIAAKYQGNINSKSNIKIIESYRLGGNKFVSIIKIGGDYYALGIGKDEITLIDKISEESIDLSNYEKMNNQKYDFKEILSKVRKKELSDTEGDLADDSQDKND